MQKCHQNPEFFVLFLYNLHTYHIANVSDGHSCSSPAGKKGAAAQMRQLPGGKLIPGRVKVYSFTPPTATPAMMNLDRHRYTTMTGRMDRQIIMYT